MSFIGVRVGVPMDSSVLGGSGSAYDHASQALFAAMTTPPTTARKILIDAAIVALKAAGVWSLLDCLWMMAAADSQAALLNWVKPSAFTLTPVNSPAFTADRGYQGNGTSSYLNTGFQPSTAVSPQYALNSAHASVWSLTNSAADVTDLGVNGSTASIRIDIKRAANTILGRDNDATNMSAAVADSLGYFFIGRSTSAARRIRKATAQVIADTAASVSLPNNNVYICAINSAGVSANFSSRQIASASLGGNLSDAQSDSLQGVLQTYLQAVGAV